MADYHYLWTAYTREVCVCWEVQEWPDGRRNRQMVALLVFGKVDSTNVREIPFATINAADPTDYPCWRTDIPFPTSDPPQPPTFDERARAWAARPETKPRRKVKLGPREPGEDVDTFYSRVADAYRMLADKSGKPTTQLATLAGVERGTAARWVHQARLRGFLPPTTRGKAAR